MYDNLDQSKNQIRLFRLLPGREVDEIHCELFTVSLDESNEFEALSYVWGSTNDLLRITLCGQKTDVTTNLESALRHLRNDEKERILWVDAVCINQEDIDERKSQVQLMQRIYSGASQVVVWLGPLEDEDEQTIEIIGRLGSNPKSHWTAIPNMDIELIRLYVFLRHEWWSRIWTAQEAVLAKHMVYYRGNIRLSSHVLANMAASYREHVLRTQCCHSLKRSNLGFDAAENITTVTENILQIRQFELGTQNPSFDEVALMFRNRQATNPLDKVYGLLGISCGIKKSSINYEFSKAKAYELATRDSISHNNNLNILSHILPPRTAMMMRDPSDWSVVWSEDIPSWVPDWMIEDNKTGSDIELMRYRVPFLDHYNACGTLTYESTKDNVDGKLHVAGVCCDTIEVMSDEILLRNFLSPVNIIRDWRRLAEMEKDPGKAYVGGDTVSEAFWRTLCLDIHARDALGEGEVRLIRRAGAEERAAHLVFWDMLLSGRRSVMITRDEAGLMERVAEFAIHVLKAMARRSFFISRKGYIGLAPAGAEIGDRLCILAGGRVPFVLRPVSQNDSQATSRFVCRLVGESYIHGLMDGEAMQLVDDGVLQIEDFELI